MKKIIIFLCSLMFTLSCSSPRSSMLSELKGSHQYRLQQQHDFSEVPHYLLDKINLMGIDSCRSLNEYEGEFLNYIYNVDPKESSLVGKKLCFINGRSITSKNNYFEETKRRYNSNYTIIGGSTLYLFDAKQKKDSGGYDAAIIYWSKFFLLPTEDVINIIKRHKC